MSIAAVPPRGQARRLTAIPTVRRGAHSLATVDRSVLEQMELGLIESRTHVEQMAMNMQRLLESAFPRLAGFGSDLGSLTFLARMRRVGSILWNESGFEGIDQAATHRSDTVRGWAGFAIAAARVPLPEQLAQVRCLADDAHFAVREWAWLSVRPAVLSDPRIALQLLEPWAMSGSARVRRFASEATRPRGVWSRHIRLLRQAPWHGRALLDALSCDRDRYVATSVGSPATCLGSMWPA